MRLFVLALYVLLLGCVTSRAQAEPRFGDSSWVAPAGAIDAVSAIDGPRIAPHDHERRWESAVRVPFRVAFFPLRLIADGLEAGAGVMGPHFLDPKPIRLKPGFSIAPTFTIGGINDLGAGPALTWVGIPTAASKMRLAGSWSSTDHRRARFSGVIGERQPVGVRLRADYDYKPNRHFYGIGNNTASTDLSYFLLASTTADAALLLGASPLRQVRFAGGYSSMSAGRGYGGRPLLEDVYTPISAPYEHRTAQSLWFGVAADLAALDDARTPSRGVHGRIDVRRAAGLQSSDPNYTQWRAEGRAYLPVFAKRRVVAMRGVYAGLEPSDAGTTLPYYLLSQSDGTTAFAGYPSARFHDRQLMLGRIEYRWAIFHGVSALALYELGEVAPRVESFSLRDSHISFGGGLRYARYDGTILRFEFAKSTEGMHAALALGADF